MKIQWPSGKPGSTFQSLTQGTPFALTGAANVPLYIKDQGGGYTSLEDGYHYRSVSIQPTAKVYIYFDAHVVVERAAGATE